MEKVFLSGKKSIYETVFALQEQVKKFRLGSLHSPMTIICSPRLMIV